MLFVRMREILFWATPFWLLYFPFQSLRVLIFFIYVVAIIFHTHAPPSYHANIKYVIASYLLFTSIVTPEYNLPIQALRGFDFVYACIDDLLIASSSEAEHLAHLDALFTRLSEYGIVISTIYVIPREKLILVTLL